MRSVWRVSELSLEAEVEFTILVDGVERRLFLVKERANDDLIFVPTFNCGDFDRNTAVAWPGENASIELDGETSKHSLSYTVHLVPEHPVMSRVNYHKRQHKLDKTQRFLTNALKVPGRYFPLCFYASGDLRPAIHDPRTSEAKRICVGEAVHGILIPCHQVLLSSKETDEIQIHSRSFGVYIHDFRSVRLHLISFNIFMPGWQGNRGIRASGVEISADLNSKSEEFLAELIINSCTSDIIMQILHTHVNVVRDNFLPRLDTSDPIAQSVTEMPQVVGPVSPLVSRYFMNYSVGQEGFSAEGANDLACRRGAFSLVA